MRDKWSALSNMAIERQRKLEEALLFSGHFNEAVDALLDWLNKVEPTLAPDKLIHGDLDTVTGLLDDHKTFLKEMDAREANVDTIRKAAEQLISAGDAESNAEVESRLNDVNAKWDVVKRSASLATERLNDAKMMVRFLMVLRFLNFEQKMHTKCFYYRPISSIVERMRCSNGCPSLKRN